MPIKKIIACMRLLTSCLFLFFFSVGYAQPGNSDSGQHAAVADTIMTQKTSKPPVSRAAQPIEILDVFNKNHRDSTAERHNMASIGDIIVIKVSNIDSLLRRSQCKDAAGNPVNGCVQQPINLFINGRMITNIEPLSGAPRKDSFGNGELQYQLERNQDNDEVWAELLGAPPLFSKRSFIEPVTIGIGLKNEHQLNMRGNSGANFNMIRIHKGWFWTCLVGIAIYLLIVFVFIKNSGLLRDRHMDLSVIGILPTGGLPPYSLGRFQMAFWFTLFIISFLFIWLITDAYDIINSSVLALIGISAGTSLSALVIDNSKRQELLNKTKALQLKLADPNTGAHERPQIQDEIDANKKVLTPAISESFLKDILNDVNGASFHRMQMLVWTIVLGLIFVFSVWKRLSMPAFDATLLALQGITAGTYLGFKFPERQS